MPFSHTDPTAGSRGSRAIGRLAGTLKTDSARRLALILAGFLLCGAGAAWALKGEAVEDAGVQALATIEGTLSDPLTRQPEGAFVPSADRHRAEIWAVGDAGDGSAAATEVAQLIDGSEPDRLLYLGDVYEVGSADEFATNYAPSFGSLSDITAPTLGNHEAPNVTEGYEAYWRQIYGTTPPSFYSFRIAGWQILSLNSEIDHSEGSAQVRWLEQRVSAPGNCRIAFWHRPRFSAGTEHGDDPGLQPFWDALGGRARLAVNAHEHDFQRQAARDGVTQLIAGAGGESRYPLDPAYSGLRFGDDEATGALRLRLRPGRLSYAFVDTRRHVLDSGSRRCEH